MMGQQMMEQPMIENNMLDLSGYNMGQDMTQDMSLMNPNMGMMMGGGKKKKRYGLRRNNKKMTKNESETFFD